MEKKKSVKDTLAELAMMRKASKERQAGKTTNPLMKDFKERMEKRETEKAKEEAKAAKKAAKGGGSKYGPTAMKAGAQLVTLLVVETVKAIHLRPRLTVQLTVVKAPLILLVATKKHKKSRLKRINLHRLHHVSVAVQAAVKMMI
jgi:hypothetical protein